MEQCDWRPRCDPDTARLRASMLQSARRYFHAIGVLEVDTPALSVAAASDPQIESVGANLAVAGGREYYLHTSPEYCMKRLLCAGYPDIYQICKVFRDGESGRMHQPEFTMIEWYRHGLSLHEIICDCLALIGDVLGDPGDFGEPATLNYRDAFIDKLGIDPIRADIAALRDLSDADEDLAQALADDRDAWLDLLLSEKIVPSLPDDSPTVIYHYPASQAALARLCPANNAVADRFEVFLGRVELANGYVELTDPSEQQERFSKDQLQRQNRDQQLRPLDYEFLAAIRSGMPDCAGVAVGFDRLLMIRASENDIRDIQTFDFAGPL